jgi:hypothetical protein
MTKTERNKLGELYAGLNILCGILAPDITDKDFPNRIPTAYKKAGEAYGIVESMLIPIWKKENKDI